MRNNTPPEIRIPERIDIPTALSEELPNGVRLYRLDCSDQEVARVSFVFHAGSSVQSVPFSASATANLLSEGTERYSAQEIAEKLDFYGSYYDVSLDRDYAVITFCSLLKFLPQTLEIAREILLYPTFPEEEIAVYCSKRKQRLAVERSKVSVQARELFTKTLFGPDHPYGISYPEMLYDNLSRDTILSFYRQYYTAQNCFVVSSGQIKEQEREQIATLAADIPTGDPITPSRIAAAMPERFAFNAYPGAVQSAIRIGIPLFPRSHPDFIALQVAATLLGGYFGSRLVHNLREECGYTYGVFAAMVNLEQAGYLAIATEVATEVTADAVKRIFDEIIRLRTTLVEEKELQMVRNIMLGEVMRILDGPFGVADVTIENVENGTDNSYLHRLLHEVRTITPERILEIAQQYLAPERFTTAIVGDGSIASEVQHTLFQ